MQIVVEDLLTQYEISGKGKLLILLHGWGDSSKGMLGLQRYLEQDFRVLVLDLPGFGGTQLPKDTWDLHRYAEFVGATLKKLTLDDPYALIGHSNGGAIAIKCVSENIINPKKLILIAASGVRPSRTIRRTTFTAIAKSGKLATVWLPGHYRQTLRKKLYSAAGSDMLVAPGLEETFKKTVREDIKSDAAKITIPTLLIFSDADNAVPKDSGKTYQHVIANSRLETISGAGHFIHIDQKERVEQVIGAFL